MMKRFCWFCQKECFTFISICEDCAYEKITKKNNQMEAL